MNHPERCCAWTAVAVGMLVVTLAPAAHAAPARWLVANNGVDNFGCGAPVTNPCRSVSMAISNAAAGDVIIVGPGVYGDLNGDGTLADSPGEEAAPGGCNCMIQVDKPLTITSRDGAEVTILDAGGITQDVVHIIGPQANGTVFGKVNKGFTLRNGGSNGIETDVTSQKVKVQGNIAVQNGTYGFLITGDGGTGTGNSMVTQDNVAADNGAGLSLGGDFNLMQGNRAVSNTGSGFVIGGNGHKMFKNYAVENDNGFEPILSAPFPPFFSNTPGFKQNAAIGNSTAGVSIAISSQSLVRIFQSNLYGNGDPHLNCGVAVNNNDPNPETSSILVDTNFWGTPVGPGPNPGDDGGGAAAACNTDLSLGNEVFTGPSAMNPLVKEVSIGEKPLK